MNYDFASGCRPRALSSTPRRLERLEVWRQPCRHPQAEGQTRHGNVRTKRLRALEDESAKLKCLPAEPRSTRLLQRIFQEGVVTPSPDKARPRIRQEGERRSRSRVRDGGHQFNGSRYGRERHRAAAKTTAEPIHCRRLIRHSHSIVQDRGPRRRQHDL